MLESAEAPAAPQAEAAPAGEREAILPAEDERGVRDLVTLALREAGYTAVEAVDCERIRPRTRASGCCS